ncbi:hypothetical protein NBRC116602_30190 [Hyphomicrobiales bacterium 4NK60-0047b]
MINAKVSGELLHITLPQAIQVTSTSSSIQSCEFVTVSTLTDVYSRHREQ